VTKPPGSPLAADADVPTYEYSIRITLSPGCHVYDPLDVQLDSRHCISCAPRRSLTPHGNWKKVIETLRARFHQVKLPKSFVAVNLSDAFSFQERRNSDADALAMKPPERTASKASPAAPGLEGDESRTGVDAASEAANSEDGVRHSAISGVMRRPLNSEMTNPVSGL